MRDSQGQQRLRRRGSYAKNLSEVVMVRLDPATLEQLQERAEQDGESVSGLIRNWVRQHLELPADA